MLERRAVIGTSPEPGSYVIHGRQPMSMVISPSSQSPWIGWVDRGQRFTRTQIYYLRKRGLDPATVEGVMVRRCATQREMFWGRDDPTPAFEFECPLILRRADGRLNILAPSGESKIVMADGWVAHPKKKRPQGGF